MQAIVAFVAAVAELAFAALLASGGIAFEIGAGQVVEQHFELGGEKVFLAFLKVAEQGGFVFRQTVVAAVEGVKV